MFLSVDATRDIPTASHLTGFSEVHHHHVHDNNRGACREEKREVKTSVDCFSVSLKSDHARVARAPSQPTAVIKHILSRNDPTTGSNKEVINQNTV